MPRKQLSYLVITDKESDPAMRKWLMRFTFISITVMLLKSQHGLIDPVTNFMIDGVVPFTNFALGGFLSSVFILGASYLVYRSISDLRFSMLKRRAILYNQDSRHAAMTVNRPAKSSQPVTSTAEDMELAGTSF